MAQADSPSTPPVEFVNDGAALECCAACHYWLREKLQKTNEGACAPCRRFPRTATLMTQVVMGKRGPEPQQVAVMLTTMQPATEVCGEFRIRVHAP